MPPFPGEEREVTLFVDCHYYFAQPTARPHLHRFDKGSYLYLYYNPTRQTSRIEVANNVGTQDQDAFHGYLDTCRVANDFRFPTLVTIVVDALERTPSAPASKVGRDPEEWQLPTADPRAPPQAKYRLHTIDLYLWTQEDARSVTNFMRRLLHPSQLLINDQQPVQGQSNTRANDTGVSAVVQNLEHVAISDPAYSNGQTRNSQNQAQSQTMSLPPPPPPPPSSSMSQAQSFRHQAASPSAGSISPVSELSHTGSTKINQTKQTAVDFTPMAYNPAAPPAPEKIAHREKTPPPEDGVSGTGLTAAALHDQPPQANYVPSQSWGAPPASSQVTTTHQWGSPPPSSAPTAYGAPPTSIGYGSPPPSSQHQQSRTQGALMTPSMQSFAPPPTTSTVGPDAHRHSTAAEIYTPHQPVHDSQIPETPGAQFYETIPQPAKPLQHIQPQYPDYLSGGTKPGAQPPPGGWAEYDYGKGGSGGHHGHQHHGSHGDDYNLHQQVYIPTEAEGNPRKHSKPSKVNTSSNSKMSEASRKFASFKEKLNKF